MFKEKQLTVTFIAKNLGLPLAALTVVILMLLCFESILLDGAVKVSTTTRKAQVVSTYYQPAYHHGAAAKCSLRLAGQESSFVPASLHHCYPLGTPEKEVTVTKTEFRNKDGNTTFVEFVD